MKRLSIEEAQAVARIGGQFIEITQNASFRFGRIPFTILIDIFGEELNLPYNYSGVIAQNKDRYFLLIFPSYSIEGFKRMFAFKSDLACYIEPSYNVGYIIRATLCNWITLQDMFELSEADVSTYLLYIQ